jgi:hypothetical protein
MSTWQRYDELRVRVFRADAGDEASTAEMQELLILDERLKEQAQIRSDAQRKFEGSLHGASRIAYALRKGG